MLDFGNILDSLLKVADVVAGEVNNQRMQKQGEYRVKIQNYENLSRVIADGNEAKRDARRELRESGIPTTDEYRRD